MITMPGATRVPQEGTNPFAFSTFTRQTQQEAYGSSRGSLQSVGIFRFWRSATSRMVRPGSTRSFRPSRVISIMPAGI
ncbi:MAG: hypothetical protein A2177_07975 [Spirochaetes bacterium RBG_13_68_11]|nr:MAG: hypothetical protein A2177_07975 [Spirochaetes bacterium RBG_13_68_11]